MPYEPVDLVEVRAWGHTVGAIAPTPGRRGYAFQYDPAWVRGGLEPAPLLMPLDARHVYTFPQLNPETFLGLPPMIADSLPDRFGNTLIDAWLAREGIGTERITALDRLGYLASRGMGALEYRPDRSPSSPTPTALDLRDLVESARKAVRGELTTEETSRAALERIISVGTSAGGARAKAVIRYDPEDGEIRSGHAETPERFQPWIIKLDGMGADRHLGVGAPYGRIEYAYSRMACDAGITMMPTRLLEENGRGHFLTRRFDEVDGRRLHMQSLCALAAVDFNAVGANDYAQLFTTIERLDLGPEARLEAFRRMVFNVVARNCDDHSKNHAFLMDEEGRWSLSPAYDVTFAYSPDSVWLRQHLMAVDGKTSDITRSDLMRVADRFAVAGAASVIDEVTEAVLAFDGYARDAGVPDDVAERISGMLTPLPR